jgi:hypothetical protein
MTREEIIRQLVNEFTPGGSEFVENPARCLDWIKQRRDSSICLVKQANQVNRLLREDLAAAIAERDRLRATIEKLRGILGVR